MQHFYFICEIGVQELVLRYTIFIFIDFRSYVDDEDYYYDNYDGGDLVKLPPGANGCRGTLVIDHRKAGDPNSELRFKEFHPSNYTKTRKQFRGREISNVQVWGNCQWHLYRKTRFAGRNISLVGGWDSHVNILPASISQP